MRKATVAYSGTIENKRRTLYAHVIMPEGAEVAT